MSDYRTYITKNETIERLTLDWPAMDWREEKAIIESIWSDNFNLKDVSIENDRFTAIIERSVHASNTTPPE